MGFANTLEVLNKYGEEVVRRAKMNLNITLTIPTAKATGWRNGQPTGVKKGTKKRRVSASGKLRDSIAYEIKETDTEVMVNVLGADYWEVVDKGRKPKLSKGASPVKGVPVDTLAKWSETKKIKPRDLNTGKFIKNTPKNRQAMNFLMNRKIRWFGTAPTQFMTYALNDARSIFEDEITQAVLKDVAKNISDDNREGA